mgnify:CR=1 FL=1
MKDPFSDGYDFVSREVNWELFKKKVKEILAFGASKAQKVASEKLRVIRDAVGLGF